jgi:uncharacterized protein YjiS (DUF1127 family)
MTAASQALPAQPAGRECGRLISYARGALALLNVWRQRMRDRSELARLDQRSLRDLGLTPHDALYEVRKPFWRE